MLAGARCGARALPARWLRQLAPAVRHAVADPASALLALAIARRPAVSVIPPERGLPCLCRTTTAAPAVRAGHFSNYVGRLG